MSLDGRIPPHDLDAEAALLGCVMLDDKQLEVSPVADIAETDFYKDAHRSIWLAIKRLFEAGNPPDLVMVQSVLSESGQLENVGGMSYLVALSDTAATAAYAPHYAKVILEKSKLRQIIALSGEAMRMAYNQEQDVSDILAGFESRLTQFAAGKRERGVTDFYLEAEAVIDGLVGAPTGFTDLDKFTGGMTKPGLNILAGRPSMGKSALARHIVRNYQKNGKKVFWASYDQGGGEILLMEACAKARVSINKIRRGEATDYEKNFVRSCLAQVREEYRDLVQLVDLPAPLERVISMCRAAVRGGAELVVVDYLQLVDAPGGNDQERTSRVSKAFKTLANECVIPVLGLAQLSRAVEARPDKRPLLSDLRESGQLEQDANQVWMMYRDDYYDQHSAHKGKVEVIVRKHKTGPVGTVELFFNADLAELRGLWLGAGIGGTP
jgi:replicative DNA helicase